MIKIVVPQIPYPPRKGLEIPEGGGFKGPGISGEEEGYFLNEFCFFPDWSQFSYSCTLSFVVCVLPIESQAEEK